MSGTEWNWWLTYHEIMINCHYTPGQINDFTIPHLLCLSSKKPPTEKKLESASDYQAVIEEDARREKEWMGSE